MAGERTDITVGRSPAECIRQACRLEATARKPGNVHPACAFPDLSYADFLAAADAAGPWLAQAASIGVGTAIEESVRATRRVAASNVNLGIALLIAPLAAVSTERPLDEGVVDVLNRLTVDDTRAVYRAIRLAAPGGLGTVPEQDVTAEPTLPLKEVMNSAADRDRVAKQYATGFVDVLHVAVPRLITWWERSDGHWETAVIGLHLSLLSEFPDSLIQRKCGAETAADAARRARHVLKAGWPCREGQSACAAFDAWLRADGHRRNPGTTADLVAATLFVTLRDELLPLPAV